MTALEPRAVPFREARVDLGAVRVNTRRALAGLNGARLAADLGGDAFGHGAVDCVRTILEAGASEIHVPSLDEAVRLRESGVNAPIVSTLHAPGETFDRAAGHGITVAIRNRAEWDSAIAAGVEDVLLVPETGCGLPGLDVDELTVICSTASVSSLFRGALLTLPDLTLPDEAGERADALALAEQALGVISRAGLPLDRILVCGGTQDLPPFATTAVVGEALFGLDREAEESRAAMTLWAPVVAVKDVDADEGVSYGYTYRTAATSTLALVPLGYGDGVDRAAGNVAPVLLGGRTYTIAGRVAMDAHVVDLGGDPAPRPGDAAVLFGNPADGHPDVARWAHALGITPAEVTTRLTARVHRSRS